MLLLKYFSMEVISVLGVYYIFKKAKFPDFGILGSYLLASFLSAKIIFWNCPIQLIPIIGLFSGITVGFLTAILHFKVKLNPILSGICSLFFVYSVSYFLFKEGSFNYKDSFISSDLIIILTFLGFFLLFYFAMFLVEITSFGVRLRASSFSNLPINYLKINSSKYLSFYLIFGNALIGFNSSLKVLVKPNVALNMTSGVLEELIIEMVLGLFILDLALLIIQKYFKGISSIIFRPIIIRITEILIPLSGTIIFQSIYSIGYNVTGQGFHLRALIASILIIITLFVNKLSFSKYSTLKFLGVNA